MDHLDDPPLPRQLDIHIVTSANSPEFALLRRSLSSSSVVGLDAEWKPIRGSTDDAAAMSSFPFVALLQIACRSTAGESSVFLVDLLSLPLAHVFGMLNDVFVAPNVLKLGFRFKQDLAYLSSTFAANGSHSGFDRVEPFLDITSIYHHLKNNNIGKWSPKQTKSLAKICEEILGVSLSKKLQCSDWSYRPLTEEQICYAAADAYYLLEIFSVFQQKCLSQGRLSATVAKVTPPYENVGLKEILEESDLSGNILRTRFCKASDMIRVTTINIHLSSYTALAPSHLGACGNGVYLDDCVMTIAKKYGEKLVLKESDRKPKTSKKRKGKRQAAGNANYKQQLECNGDWQGPPPWDGSVGGDGNPKFLCDVMVEGLARHLRCVGIDAAVPSIKKPEPRHLLDQAYKEKRVLLTRDVKLLKHQYLDSNQVYRVKSLLKNDQLVEVIETFDLKISEEQLMSRCTKCNGSFIQKPLTMEEAVAASRGFQVIPNCLFDRDIEFWQCRECKQLYWEGTRYQNAVQKFVSVCKLSDD